jgi:hypothetical protein
MKLWRKWEPREDEFLRKHYGKWHSMQIANALSRPQKAVWNHAQYLKLAKMQEPRKDVTEKAESGKPIEEPEEKIVGLAHYYDPFGRQLAIFCIKNITVHRLAGIDG